MALAIRRCALHALFVLALCVAASGPALAHAHGGHAAKRAKATTCKKCKCKRGHAAKHRKASKRRHASAKCKCKPHRAATSHGHTSPTRSHAAAPTRSGGGSAATRNADSRPGTSTYGGTAAGAAVPGGAGAGAQGAATQADGAASGRKLSWAPPALNDPTTVQVTRPNQVLKLDDTRDYIVKFPDHPLVGAGGMTITGGHNVVLIGGEIDIPYQGDNPPTCCHYGRGLQLLNQTGTVHIEGLYMHGEDINEGIDLGEGKGAVVQIENVRIEGIHARDPDPQTGVPSSTHPDLIQTWGGPRQLLVDGLTGTTDYQGFFLHPNQLYDGPAPELFDFRNVEVAGLAHARYLMWKVGDWPLRLTNVWAKPIAGRWSWGTFWPDMSAWSGVQQGTPSTPMVARGEAGAGYVSPGYVEDRAPVSAARMAQAHPTPHRAAKHHKRHRAPKRCTRRHRR